MTDWRSLALDALRGGIQGATTGALGGPVDLATMALRPLGYSVEKPIGGSEWWRDQLQSIGAYGPRTSSTGEKVGELAGAFAMPGPDPIQWASLGLGVAKMAKADDLAKSLQRWAEEMGLTVERSASKLSGSRYLNVSRADKDGNLLGGWKIRVSDHDLPPTYAVQHGEADYEVGSHSMGARGGVPAAVSWLSDVTGLPVPSGIKGAVTRHQSELAAEVARQQADAARAATRMEDIRGGVARLSAMIGETPSLRDDVMSAMSIQRNDKRNKAVDRIADAAGVDRQSVKDWFYSQQK